MTNDDLVNKLLVTGETRIKATATDQKGHYTKIVAAMSVSDGELMLQAAGALMALQAMLNKKDG